MSKHMASAPRPKPRKRRRSWAQRGVIVIGALSTLALAGSAAGMTYLYKKVERIPRVELSAVLDEVDEAGGPQNYLIVGVDNADRTNPDDDIRVGRQGEQNTDTIMVMRIDPSSQQAMVLSLPRDLWVPFPDGGSAKINSAFVRGGKRPDLLIGIINNYLGIPIHHYAQVDLAGFHDLVNAIDGVPVYFPAPARDTHSGLAVFQTGCVTLDAEMALNYARSRYYEELVQGDGSRDRDWRMDPQSDLGRIRRQQDFISRALERAISKGARNPGTLDRLLDVALTSVVVDDELTPGAIFDLAKRFRSFDPDMLGKLTLPVVGGTSSGGASILKLIESQAQPVLALFRDPPAGAGGETGEIDPAAVRLTVLNGTGEPGQGADVAGQLGAAGFAVLGSGDSQEGLQERTTVRYPAGSRAEAEFVARWLGSGAELVEVPLDQVAVEKGIEVITGADWAGVLAAPMATTTTTIAASGTTASTAPTTTTTLPSPGNIPANGNATSTSDYGAQPTC